MKALWFISCALIAGACRATAQPHSNPGPTNISPEAERVFRAACQYLTDARAFGLRAEIWREHVTDSGQKVQFSRKVAMEVKRPNRLHADIGSSHAQREFWYDGKSLSVLDGKANLFSTTPMPATLDEALDAAHDQFGIDLPLIDLALSDPYRSGMAKVEKATYYGLAPVMGFECHHLAFTQANIDWQVWIQAGPQPLIRKFIITHKNEPGAPEFTALIQQWDLTSPISDSDFVFEPPRGASKVEMRRDTMLESENTGSPRTAALSSPKEKP